MQDMLESNDLINHNVTVRVCGRRKCLLL